MSRLLATAQLFGAGGSGALLSTVSVPAALTIWILGAICATLPALGNTRAAEAWIRGRNVRKLCKGLGATSGTWSEKKLAALAAVIAAAERSQDSPD